MLRRGIKKTLCFAVFGLVSFLGTAQAFSSESEVKNQIGVITLAQLPSEGQHTYQLIHQGGPFPFEKDGSIFGNRERLLPLHSRGYYREYTVKTAGLRGRGGRRIVCGGAVQAPDKCYYTKDHYSSFLQIKK